MSRCRPKGEHEAAEYDAIFEIPQWTCSLCNFKADSSTGLRKHTRGEHNKCLRCRIMFKSAEEFHEHLLRANCSQKLCFVCKLDFSSGKSLAEHRVSSHRPPDDGVTRQMVLSGAMADGSGTEHGCDFCSKSFQVEDELEAHLQREHFHCFPCSREFSHKKSLINHLKSLTRHHFCSICETDFPNSEALRKHRYSGIHEDPAELRIPRPSSAIRWHEDAERLRRYMESKKLKLGEARRNLKSRMYQDQNPEEEEIESAEYAKLADRLSRLTRFLDRLEECNPEYADIVRIQKLADGFRLPLSSSEEEDDSDVSTIHEEFNERHYLRCSLCPEEFDSPLDREFHDYDNHQWCTVCKKQYASRRVLTKHILSTRGHNFCFDCCQVFFLKEMLADHRKSVWHASSVNKPLIMSDKGVKKKVYVCDDCHVHNVYTSEQGLQRHLDQNHFYCLECDRTFNSRKALIEHYARSTKHHSARNAR